jgi:FKBP-type peptidyl-prolyl cis-trans isomerase FklB
MMPVGSKWKLFLPSELAYGERGAGGKIGPNSVLVFEVELLSIDAPDAPQGK